MINQLYHRESQVSRLYTADPYAPLGLEPNLNELITLNAPELRLGKVRHALCEYGAMIHVHRVAVRRIDEWVGFTSWRQADKGIPQLGRSEIDHALSDSDVASWGQYDNSGGLINTVRDLPTFTIVFNGVSVPLPHEWFAQTTGTFGNYWAMRWEDFDDYMDWSRTFLDWIVRHFDTVPALHSRGPSSEPFIGEFFERLFDIWRVHRHKRVHYLHSIKPSAELPRSHDVVGPDL